MWDLRVGEVTYTIVGPKITGDSIDIRDDYILTGSNRITDQLQLWDYRSKSKLYTFKWDSDPKVFFYRDSLLTQLSTVATSVPTLETLFWQQEASK